jgi:hypothetical protein
MIKKRVMAFVDAQNPLSGSLNDEGGTLKDISSCADWAG